MANPSNKQMLRDANGDLIPQYWDVVAGDFKPLTGQGGAQDTRLTGSNVEKAKEFPRTIDEITIITPGSSYTFARSGVDGSEMRGVLRFDPAIDPSALSIRYQFQTSGGLTLLLIQNDDPFEFGYTNSYACLKPLKIHAKHLTFSILNQSEEDVTIRAARFIIVGG